MRQARAFTLLEAVLATVILASVLLVCVDLRGRSIAQAERITEHQLFDRESQVIFSMATSGFLDEPHLDSETHMRTWSGEHLGERYQLVAEPHSVENPVVEHTNRSLSPDVYVWRYTLTYRGRTAEFLWH